MHRAASVLIVIVGLAGGVAPAAADDTDEAAALDHDRGRFHVAALKGPFYHLVDYCRQAGDPEFCYPDEDGQTDDEADPRRLGLSFVRGRGRIRAARVFVDGDACHLAILTDAWWIREDLDLCMNRGTGMHVFRITELALRNLVGGKEPEVMLRMRSDSIHRADGWTRYHQLVLCGINDAEEVECLPNIIEDHRHRCFVGQDGTCSFDGRRRPPTRSSIAVAMRKRGLAIAARRGPLIPAQHAILGRHALDWR
jgi:hypothetical protein